MALAITSTNLKTRDTVSDTGEYTHTSRDDLLRPSAVIQINGTDFGATQGNSNVYIANGTTFASATKVLQTPSSWSNTLIELTVDLGSFFESDKLYIFVAYEEGEVGEVISSAHWVTISEPDVHYDFGYFQLSPGIGDDFVIISEKQLGYVPKVVHMKFTASIENAYYYRADPIAFAEAFLVYDPATSSFDCITTEFYMTSYTAGVSKVYRTTDQFSFTHYLDNTAGTFQVSTFDVRYVDGVGIVLDHNSNTMEYGLTIGYSVYGGRTVKGDIAHAAADAETVSFDVEPSFCRVYSINTTSTTTNSSSDGRYSVGIIDRNQDEFLCLSSLTDDETYSSSSAFGGRNDGAGGVQYSIGSPDFTNHMQLDWTLSATHANDGNTFFFCVVDLDGYWADVNSGTVPASTSTTVSIARDPEFAETITNDFGSTPTYTGVMYFTALYYDKCKFNHGYTYDEMYGDSNIQDAKIEHMYCGFNVVNEFNQAYVTKGISDKSANGYFPGELLKFQLVAEKADLGTTTTLSASSYAGGQTWYGSNKFGIFSIEKLDDRPIITSVKSTGFYESMHTYPEHMLKQGNTATITGTGFGASQGTQKVYISDAVNLNDATAYEELAVTSWSATSITLTVLALKTWMRHTSKGLHLCIVDGTAQTSKAYPVTCISELDDSHISSHVFTYTGASAGGTRRDHQLIAESSLKDPYPKGFIILANRNLSNGLESNSSGNSGVDQTIVTLSVNQFLGVQRAVLSSISSSLISSTANETSYMSSDFIVDASGRNYTFRHCDPGSGSSRTSMEAIIRYKPGSGLYMDVLSDYSTSETIEFRILCFYGPSTIACAQFVTASSSRTTDIDIYRFGFRANSGLLHNIGGNYNLYSTSNARLAVGVFDKDANGAAYYQSYVSSSSQEGLITGSYAFIPYGSTTTGYYFTIDSIEDEYVDFNSANAFYGAASLGLWRGNLDSAAGLDTVAVNTGLSTDVPAGTAANKLLFYIFSDNTSTTYTEDFGPYSIGFAVKDEGEYSQGAMVDLDLSRLYSGNRDDACGIVPTSLTEYIYVQVDDFNFTGSTPRLNFQANTGSPSILNGRFYQWALEEGEGFLVQSATISHTVTFGTFTVSSEVSGDTITQDGAVSQNITIASSSLTPGAASASQAATLSHQITIGATSLAPGPNSIAQAATLSHQISFGTFETIISIDQTATISVRMSFGTFNLENMQFVPQDATINNQVTFGASSLQSEATISQDGALNIGSTFGASSLSPGPVSLVQDGTVSVNISINPVSLSAGVASVAQDGTVSNQVSFGASSLAPGAVSVAQDSTVSNQISFGSFDFQSEASVSQDGVINHGITLGATSLVPGPASLSQDVTVSNDISFGAFSLDSEATISQDGAINVNLTIGATSLDPGAVSLSQAAMLSHQITFGSFSLFSGSTVVQDGTINVQSSFGTNDLTPGSISVSQDATIANQISFGTFSFESEATTGQDATINIVSSIGTSNLIAGNVNVSQDGALANGVTFGTYSLSSEATISQDSTISNQIALGTYEALSGASIAQDGTINQQISFGSFSIISDQIAAQSATINHEITISPTSLDPGAVNLTQDGTVSNQVQFGTFSLASEATISQDASLNIETSFGTSSLDPGDNTVSQASSLSVQIQFGTFSVTSGDSIASQNGTLALQISFGSFQLENTEFITQDSAINIETTFGIASLSAGAASLSQSGTLNIEVTIGTNDLILGSVLNLEEAYAEFNLNTQYAEYSDKSTGGMFAVYYEEE